PHTTSELSPLSLHDALPILRGGRPLAGGGGLVTAGGAGGRQQCERDGNTREPTEQRDQSSLSAWMRSSRGGCVSNRRLSHESLPDRKSTRLNSSHLGISYAV